MISVLCVNRKTVYRNIPGLDLWDQVRDAYNFAGSNPVITHAPCQQWSRMKAFARGDQREKDLAFFCLEKVMQNGGIFEHPAGSSFFKVAGIRPTISVNQFWWGFPIKKPTWLYFKDCRPLAHPLSFDAIEYKFGTGKISQHGKNKSALKKYWGDASKMTLPFAQWLTDCIYETLPSKEIAQSVERSLPE